MADLVTFATVRAHFKGTNKSSNKVRCDTGPYDVMSILDALRCENAGLLLTPMQNRRRPLAEILAKKVGNCTEMAYMAVHLARERGASAEVWGFWSDREFFSHFFCVIGESRGRETAALGGTPITVKAHFGDWDDVWIVDG